MLHPTDGILLIDKDEGESSYDVVRKVKIISRKENIRKIGHAGTLDPFATGLLVILLGQGTKLSHYIMSESKVYLATMRLGVETDTLDLTGAIVHESPVPDLSPEYIRRKAQDFIGDIEQTPPIYSAVKYKGVRAYKLARKGQKVTLKKRLVSIHSLRITSVELPDVTMEVKCSSGTYIRTLAADLGRVLGPGSHLTSLRRKTCGSFDLKKALKSHEILAENNSSILQEKLIPLNAALPGMKEIIVEKTVAEKVRQGRQSTLEELADRLDPAECDGAQYKLIGNGELVAIVKLNKSRRDSHVRLEIARVFS